MIPSTTSRLRFRQKENLVCSKGSWVENLEMESVNHLWIRKFSEEPVVRWLYSNSQHQKCMCIFLHLWKLWRTVPITGITWPACLLTAVNANLIHSLLARKRDPELFSDFAVGVDTFGSWPCFVSSVSWAAFKNHQVIKSECYTINYPLNCYNPIYFLIPLL
jgi:hypothetical protein